MGTSKVRNTVELGKRAEVHTSAKRHEHPLQADPYGKVLHILNLIYFIFFRSLQAIRYI